MLEILSALEVERKIPPSLSYDTVKKLLPSDGIVNDRFAVSVASSSDGSTVAIGAYYANDGGIDNSGAVYIYRFNGTEYIHSQKLIPPVRVANDYFGRSVSLSSNGSVLVIGAYGDDAAGLDVGAAYVFKANAGIFSFSQKLVPNTPVNGMNFGFSVTMCPDASIVLVGAINDNVTGPASGSIYLFKLSGNTYTQSQRITPVDSKAGQRFGISIAISADNGVIAIGAYSDDWAGTDTGAVYAFKITDTVYEQYQRITYRNTLNGSQFGYSVAISDNGFRLVIGAPGEGPGSVYIYRDLGTGYTFSQRLRETGGSIGDFFGFSVAMSADGVTVLVGAQRSNAVATAAGVAFIYKYDGIEYQLYKKLSPPSGTSGRYFGHAVAIASVGEQAVIGAYDWVNSTNIKTGAAFVFS